MSDCQLTKATGAEVAVCDESSCIYWRMVEHLDTGEVPTGACAIQHFALLEGGSEIAEWLLSVKSRLGGAAV